MTGKQSRDLEDLQNWDFDEAEVHPPRKTERVVVSVALPRATFEEVTRAAETNHLRVSEFIRAAALERATRRASGIALASVSGAFIGTMTLNGTPLSGTPGVTRVAGSGWLARACDVSSQTPEWASETTSP